jgi:hypothetical protein
MRVCHQARTLLTASAQSHISAGNSVKLVLILGASAIYHSPASLYVHKTQETTENQGRDSHLKMLAFVLFQDDKGNHRVEFTRIGKFN